MKRLILSVLVLSTLGQLAFSQTKLAQTGAQFLSVGTDAWAGGMAGAMTIIEMESASLLYNPAGMATMDGLLDITASQNQWIADINYNLFTMAVSPQNGRYGVFGASFMAIDYGEIQGTMAWDNEKGYIDTELLTPSAYALGIGYAKSLTDKFSVGGHVKQIGLDYGRSVYPDETGYADTVKNHVTYVGAFDFGTIFKTGWHSLAFGMSIRNFSNEAKMEIESYQLPLTFSMGIGMDLFDLFREQTGRQKLILTADALHYRSHPEQIKIGIDYHPIDLVAFRTGFYTSQDENTDSFDQNDLSFGFGLSQFGLVLDYAYTPMGVWCKSSEHLGHI
jgi:hypothetical protein